MAAHEYKTLLNLRDRHYLFYPIWVSNGEMYAGEGATKQRVLRFGYRENTFLQNLAFWFTTPLFLIRCFSFKDGVNIDIPDPSIITPTGRCIKCHSSYGEG